MILKFDYYFHDDILEGEISILQNYDDYYNLMISSVGYKYHVIIGTHAYGRFLCIPAIGIGCELATLNDTFWNEESIGRYLEPHIAAFLAAAITHIF